MSGILNLPDEILTQICILCDLQTLFHLSQTCKRFCACINTELLWKERWESLITSQGMTIDEKPHCKYKDMCRRFCAVFGCSPQNVEADCWRCGSALCEATCFKDRDELIIFDFGSKTTWFKYASESTGQLSMHPTVRPFVQVTTSSNPQAPVKIMECCPICIKFAKRKTASMCDLSSPFPEVKIPRPCHHPHRRGLASAFSKLSLRNLQCFDGSQSDEEPEAVLSDIEIPEDQKVKLPCVVKASGDGTVTLPLGTVPQDGAIGPDPQVAMDTACPSCPDRVAMYKFLTKHMLRRNPFFQVATKPFVLCEPTQNSYAMMVQMVEYLLTELKIPAVCFIHTAIAVSLYTDLDTCLVVDSGANNTVVTPVVSQRVLEQCTQHQPIGGHHITKKLIDIIKSKGVEGQIDESSVDSSRVKKECYLAYSVSSEAKKNIVTKKLRIKAARQGTSELHDISLSHELYLVSEDMYLNLDIPSMICNSLVSLDYQTRKRLLANIVITGGNCRLSGLSHRLTRDLQEVLPEHAGVVRVLDPRLMTGRTDAVIGASYVRKWQDANWITRKEYILWGPSRCLERTEIV